MIWIVVALGGSRMVCPGIRGMGAASAAASAGRQTFRLAGIEEVVRCCAPLRRGRGCLPFEVPELAVSRC